MLSKLGADKLPNNIPMKQAHFAQGFYNNTHFANQRFIKLAGWGPFEKVESPTLQGIAFIEYKISNKEPLPFDIYREQILI